MYVPPGSNATELGDIDVISHEGKIHLFYLTLPNHDLVSHAVSEDGLSWKPCKHAIATGEPGDCDDDAIWTMHTVKKPDGSGFRMFYTGISRAEFGQVQRVAVADSPDLMEWTKHPGNPVLESRNPHYNEDLQRVGFISFRDPFVFIEDGVWHMFVVGRQKGGHRFFSGCVVHATSPDGIEWTSQPPLFAPQQYEDMEVPSLIKIGATYYLTFHHFCRPETPYVMAESLDGPWRVPEREDILSPHCAVFRFCEWEGKTLMYHWYRGEADWKSRAFGVYRALMPPKEVDVQDNGELCLRSFSGWSRFHKGSTETLSPERFLDATSGPGDPWHLSDDGSLRGEVTGRATAMAAGEFDDFILETEVRFERGRAFGIYFRGDAGFEQGAMVRLNFRRGQVELHRLTTFDSALNRFKRTQPTEVEVMPCPLREGEAVKVRIVACAETIEVAVNDVVYLCAATWVTKTGRIALTLEDGCAAFLGAQVQPLTVPPRQKDPMA